MNLHHRSFTRIATGTALVLTTAWLDVHAYTIAITAGAKSLYLVVGVGTITGGGGTFSGGGTPANNATINNVSVTLSAANLGAGPLPMTTNSTTTNSLWDAFAFCEVPAEVYVAGFYRQPGNAAATATLTATSPANLVNGASTLSFGTISWVSGGNGDPVATIPSGTFVAGTTQTLLGITRNTWFESCLQFNYANASVLPAGTYTGRVTYTLTAP